MVLLVYLERTAQLVYLLCLSVKNDTAGNPIYHVYLGRMALLVTLLCLSRKNGAAGNPVMFI